MRKRREIEVFFQRVVRSAQLNSLGAGISLLWSMLLLGIFFCTISINSNFSKEHAIFVLVSFSLLSLCSFLWALRHWFRNQSQKMYAQKVEHQIPELRGSLLCALEIPSQADSGRIHERIVERAHHSIQSLSVSSLAPKKTLVRSLFFLSSSFLALLILQFLLPLSSLDALASLVEKPEVTESIVEKQSIFQEVKIADITLHYEFPEYTKQDPITVQNSDGTIHAPINSKVRIQARVKEEFRSVFLQVHDSPPIPAELNNRFFITTELVIDKPGTWRLLFEKEGVKASSEEFQIEVDGDNPPVVTLETTPPETLANNQSLNIRWSAQDDYGLKKIILEYEVNGKQKTKSIRDFRRTKTKYNGRMAYTPKRLGLKSGDRVELRIVAYDGQPASEEEAKNDEFAHIGKRGESATISFQVVGPKLEGERLVLANQDFLAAMIPALADFLIEPVPPSSTDAGMITWASSVQKRFIPLQEATKKHWGNEIATDYTAELVLQVLDTSNRIMRFVRTTYHEKKLGRVKKQDRETFIELHEQQIVDLEKAIYLIDRMLRMTHFQLLLTASEEAMEHTQKIDELLSKEDITRQTKKNRMTRLERALKEMDKAVKGLSDGSMKQFVVLYRQQIDNLWTEMSQRDAELDDDQYDVLLQELTESVFELHEGIQEQLRRQKNDEEKKKEEFKKLIEELKKQKKDQLDLSQELEDTRKKFDTTAQERVQMWKQLQYLADDAQEASEQLKRELGGGEGYRSGSIRQYEKQSRALRDLQNAIKARDYEQSFRELSMAMRMNRSVQSQNYTEKNRERMDREPKARNLKEVQEQSDRIEGRLQELREQLNEFDNQAQESPELRQLAQEMSSRQDSLQQRQDSLEKQTQKVEQGMPTADGSASKFLKEATESMGDAEQLLRMGRSISGEGLQRDAAQNIQKTIDRLQQQQQEMQKMKQQSQRMSGKGKQEQKENGGEKGDGEEMASNPLDLVEEMTPEEYRRRFLEGMSGSVPEEFQMLKKRYYEELVQQ